MTNVRRLLAEFDDIWPDVEAILPLMQAPAARERLAPLLAADFERMRDKALRGWLHYRGGIMRMPREQLLREIRSENDDDLIYRGFEVVRFGVHTQSP